VFALVAALALLGAASPSGALFELGAPAFRTFATSDGLPESTAQALALDAQGRLWVGTQEGVAVLLGATFQPLPLPKESRFVNAVLPAGDGSLWIGTTGSGALRYARGEWTRFDEASGLPSLHVYALAEVKGEILAGTARGLARFRGGRWSADALRASVKVLLPAAGSVWIGTESGLYRDGAALGGLPDQRIRALLAAGDELWIGTEGGLAVLRGGRISTAENEGLPKAPVTALARTAGAIWAGTSGRGLAERRGGRWRTWAKGTGLTDSHVLSLLADDRGGRSMLWIGTGGGLSRLVEGGFRSFPQGPPFLRDKVTALIDAASGFFIAAESGLHRFDGGGWTTLPLDGGRDLPWALAEDGEGALLVGSRAGHLYRFDGRALERLPFPSSPNNTVRAILEVRPPSASPELWVARRSGLLQRREGEWDEIDEEAAFPSKWFMSLAASASGRVWAGSYGGLSSFDGSAWRHWTARTGLPHDAVSSLHVDEKARALWVGTGGGGAVRIDLARADAPWTLFSGALRNGVIEQIRADREGRIYLFTNRGVSRIGAGVESFAAQDGLPSEECLFGAAAADREGRVWVGTAGGVAVLQPSAAAPSRPAALLMTRTAVRGADRALEGASLTHRENALAFEYAHLGYFRDDETRFRSQLVGLETEPTPWTQDAKREFPTLPAGDYEFRAWARDYAGAVAGPVARRFSIARAPWFSLWAIGLYAAGAVGLAAGAVRLRTRALQQRAQMLEEKVELRTRELHERNQELSTANAELVAAQQQADRIFAALAHALPGKTLDDKYLLEEKIGEGGFGAVFRARDLESDAKVAIKVFRPQSGNESIDALERFKREGASAQRLSHPNAIEVYASGVSSDGIAFLVMELLEGRSLKTELAASGKLPAPRAVQIAAQALDALGAAHALGMLHRDIKPDNIYLHRQGGREVVKVLDFGMAKLRNASLRDKSLTMSGVVVGTPIYMAPERLEEGPYDDRSDVYSMGVVLYEMLVGKPPFDSQDGNLWALLFRQVSEPPPPPSAVEPGVPAEVSAVTLRALAKDGPKRPSAAQMAAELRRACGEAAAPPAA